MIVVDWFDGSRREIRFSHIGDWTWAEFYQGYQKMEHMLHSVPYPVYILADCTYQTSHPPDVHAHFTALSRHHHHPKIAKIIVIFAHPLPGAIIRLVLRVRPHLAQRYAHVYTLDEALALCRALT